MRNTHLIAQSLHAPPAAHDERVVRSNDGEDVDALRLKLVVFLEEGREVADVAAGL